MHDMKFFVYGSLSEGFVHFSKIKDFIEHSQPAVISGTAFKLKVGFPVVLDSGSDLIPGDLVTLKESSTLQLLVNLLDEFHGFKSDFIDKSLYFRKQTKVKTQDQELNAWCYFLNPVKLPKDSVPIPMGDWKLALESEPTLISKLTEKQITYIKKLGSSSGREIVPIDLPLYRELMNLELIVDKGRRLALSKLGQEVYRYL
jgi:gamma-glutamylcyclotransferase (GGCT)/AIG2-like uncharacterized protein YtfP